MPTTNEFSLYPLDQIEVGERQRKKVTGIEELADSIGRHGLFHPVIVARSGLLVAGERRLRAVQLLDQGGRNPWEAGRIPVHYVDELDPSELQAIELEENLRRSDLTWQEDAEAHLGYHEYQDVWHDEWTIEKTAEFLGTSDRFIRWRLEVARALRAGHERVSKCESLTQAKNILDRERSRQVDVQLQTFNKMNAPLEIGDPAFQIDLGDGSAEGEGVSSSPDGAPSTHLPPVQRENAGAEVADFRLFAPGYSGPKFNLLHCDFPYGIGHHESKQGSAERHGTYEDSPETHWELLSCLLDNQERLLHPNCHIVYWFSMNFYTAIKVKFENAGFTVNPYPIIWFKSDNVGIVPDARRGPRRVYETALLIHRGDRPIVSPVSNCIAAPTGKRKAAHLSEKSPIAISHILAMLVDGTTSLLDPTCGSGSALACAYSLGAKTILGLDIEPECIETASLALNREIMRAEGRLDPVAEAIEGASIEL